jgi:hypothetical protein
MDFVAAAFGQGFDQTHDTDPGLQRMVTRDQADIAASDNEQLFGGPNKVAIDQCLESSRTIDSR